MSVLGKGSLSIKKKEVAEQKTVALGFNKIKFAHQASAGQTGFNLGTLTTPSDMTAFGFVQPSAATLLKGNLFTFRNNLKLVSSLRGLLIDQLSYTVASSSQITFQGFTAAEGEIFVGHFDEAPATSLSVVDGNQVVASGILTAGTTDFNIGTPIPINKNPLTQMGAVMVFADRGLQYRKAGNITGGDGDYIEVPVAGGLGSLIRFNASASDRYITVVSNGVVAERPDGSMMAAIERVQGQVDAIVPVLADAAGVPTTTFQTAPSSVDLKQFGDQVIANAALVAAFQAQIDAINNKGKEYWRFQGTGGYPSGLYIPYFASTHKAGAGIVATVSNSTSTGLTVTALKRCKVTMSYGKNNGATSLNGISINATLAETQSGIDNVAASKLIGISYASSVDTSSTQFVGAALILEIGDVLRPHDYDRSTGAAGNRTICNILVEEL